MVTLTHTPSRSDCSALRFTYYAWHVDMCDSILSAYTWNKVTSLPNQGPQHWCHCQCWTKAGIDWNRARKAFLYYCLSFETNSVSFSLSLHLLTVLSVWFLLLFDAYMQLFLQFFFTHSFWCICSSLYNINSLISHFRCLNVSYLLFSLLSSVVFLSSISLQKS